LLRIESLGAPTPPQIDFQEDQIEMVRSHPWISKEVPVRGFIFDVNRGRLREVMAHAEAAS
jgi:carbonic anhydrase